MTTIEDLFPFTKNYTYPDKNLNSIQYISICMEKFQELKMEPFGISPQHYKMLRTLRRIGAEGIAVYSLRKMMLNPKSDISRLVAKVEKMGLVVRSTSKLDKRKIHIAISQKGIELLEEIERRRNELAYTMPLNEEENMQLFHLLQKLVDSFANQLPPVKRR